MNSGTVPDSWTQMAQQCLGRCFWMVVNFIHKLWANRMSQGGLGGALPEQRVDVKLMGEREPACQTAIVLSAPEMLRASLSWWLTGPGFKKWDGRQAHNRWHPRISPTSSLRWLPGTGSTNLVRSMTARWISEPRGEVRQVGPDVSPRLLWVWLGTGLGKPMIKLCILVYCLQPGPKLILDQDTNTRSFHCCGAYGYFQWPSELGVTRYSPAPLCPK